ncbi:MAG TPA: PilN domain-containing protein [Solirubrobacterales bacterium]|jgi:Tfp pilus assembly protein PilN
MRPVNLIPAEDRPGQRRPMRGGPLAYIVVGALAFALLGVTMLVTTSNTISDREAEATGLESEIASAKAEVQALSAYTQFHQVREQRTATIESLANSRFDWERVMRELALILPVNVSLTSLSASAAGGGAEAGGEAGVSASAPGLSLSGCATSQAAVAGFILALKEIDGVTRVGMQSSSVGGGAGGASSASATSAGCPGEAKSVLQFQMTVLFDAAPVATEATGEEAAAPAPEAAPATTTTSEGEGEGATTSEPASGSESGEEG